MARKTAEELEQAASELDDDYLLCRDLGHAWKHQGFSRIEGGLIARRLRCRSCKTIRIDRITSIGTVYGRTYVYPDGYQLKGFGTAVFKRSVYRRIGMERAGLDEE